jgi:hypothetical protein
METINFIPFSTNFELLVTVHRRRFEAASETKRFQASNLPTFLPYPDSRS